MQKTYDVCVVGAGVFGSWTALELRRRGRTVVLLDAYGPAHARASSGGESRVIRMGYGPDEIYTRWSLRSLALWQELFGRVGRPELFRKTGVLWMGRERDPYTTATEQVLEKVGVRFEKLDRAELEKRYPQIRFGTVTRALFEPESGALLARRAVQAVVEDFVQGGGEYRAAAVAPPKSAARVLTEAATVSGDRVRAGTFVFSCGPWLPKLFPDLLRDRIHPTRQEVYFFGTAAEDQRFAPPSLPTWIDFGDEYYGIPDLENRGFKVAPDRHGPPIDPDTADRTLTPATLVAVRRFLARRFPDLKSAPLVEARVCQYENTSDGNFLIDRHPALENVWLVGGGSGHGFKHGPALGEYVAARVTEGGPVEGRFSLSTKAKVQKRAVF
jgi:monomeric sarcosine oxidase